jgi:hypothetical protein
LTTDADAPAVAVSPYGEAQIIYRVHGAPGSAAGTNRLYLTSISNALGLNAAQLSTPVAVPGAAQDSVGTPSAAIDQRGDFRVAWTQGGVAQELVGSAEATGSPVAIGSTVAALAPTTINPAGGGTTAWLTSAGGLPAVAIREDYAHGAFQLAQLTGSVPGPVAGLVLGGSGQGDALLGWTEGPAGQSEVVGDFTQAPPASFNVEVPSTWVRARNATVSWEAASDAVAGIDYAVYVDGRVRQTGLTGLTARLNSLGDGVHHVQVLATDSSGEQTMSSEHDLKLDANPPTVTLKLVDHRRGVRVTVTDRASGVDARATRIAFGDGQHTNGHAGATHVYRTAGVYRIRASVRDKVGNATTVQLRVRVT